MSLPAGAANGHGAGPVLVTGATGFLGSRLTTRLLGEGVQVRVLARSRLKAQDLEARGAEVVVGEITDPRVLRSAVKEVTVVYHLAGRLLVPWVPATEYHKTHVQGTTALLACCAESSALERFVHCSTTGVLGVTGRCPADETAPMRPTNVYEATKAQAECAVREACKMGFPAVVARPGLVYGPGDLHLLGLFRAVLRRQFRPIGRRPVWLHPIYIDDMTEALVRCGASPGAIGECFHLAGPAPVSLSEFAAAIARAAGSRPTSGYIPLPAARAAAKLADRFPAPVRASLPLTTSRLEFLTHSRVYDIGKARRVLGFQPVTPLCAGAAATVSWYRQQSYLPDRVPAGGGI